MNALFSSQYFHRKLTIDVKIAIYQYCQESGIKLRLYHNYFEKQSTGITNGYRSLCSFEYNNQSHLMEADALCGIESNGQKRILAVEIYNDEKVIRVMRALEKYRQALSIGNPSLKFGVDNNAHVLMFFRHSSMIDRIRTRLAEDIRFKLFLPYIHLLFLDNEYFSNQLKKLPFGRF